MENIFLRKGVGVGGREGVGVGEKRGREGWRGSGRGGRNQFWFYVGYFYYNQEFL